MSVTSSAVRVTNNWSRFSISKACERDLQGLDAALEEVAAGIMHTVRSVHDALEMKEVQFPSNADLLQDLQAIEVQARALLMKSNLTSREVHHVTRRIQSAADLRAAVHAAAHATKIAEMLFQFPIDEVRIVHRTLLTAAAVAVDVSTQTMAGIGGDASHQRSALGATHAYRAAMAVCCDGERSIRAQMLRSGVLSAGLLRMARAGLWSIQVAAESTARVAARYTLTD